MSSQYEDSDTVEMIIELDKDNSVILNIRADDEPFLLAKKFCYTNNIDPKIINSLAMNIRKIQSSSFNDNNRYQSLFSKDGDLKEN